MNAIVIVLKMMDDREQARERIAQADKLWWLIGGRLLAAVMLFLISFFWTQAHLGGTEPNSLAYTLPIFLAVVLLSLCYATALRFSARMDVQTGIQIFFDVLLVTWLIWATGDVRSPYVALYIIVIAVASITLGPRSALFTSVCCAGMYTIISLAAVYDVPNIYAPNAANTSIADAMQSVGINDIAFLVVGLLAGRLSERHSRSTVELIQTTQTLQNLRALHERIVESIRSGVITTDLQGNIYTFNAAAEEITGYKATEVRGQDASILFGDLTERINESLRAARANEQSPRFEADCLSPEGLRLRLGFSIFPLFSEAGATTGLVITFQDLTEVRAMEETSRRQDRLAAVGRVAASIAHEIRNPLAAMRGSIQVLRTEFDSNSSQGELMDIILRESDRLNHIITDYLTYARPRASTLADVDVCDVLRETFTLLRHSPEIRPRHVLEEQMPDGPVMAHVDAAQIKQVFWNLARNALQAMPEGGTLRAELVRELAAGRICIKFTDTGYGMSLDQVEHLFEPFSSRTGGTGLGLSIVYQIIRDHGGTINVRSREGQGTTVTIELPERQ